MLVIPAIDLDGGRSRIVYWPGAGSGIGAPTDRPDRIAERFVAMGARLIHLVDFDGARAGQPGEPRRRRGRSRRGSPSRSRSRAAWIRPTASAWPSRRERPGSSSRRSSPIARTTCGRASPWPATGSRSGWIRGPERLAAFPWRRAAPPTVDGLIGELVGAGVARFVLTHGGAETDDASLARTRELVRSYDAEILVAGGVRDIDGLRRLRDTGVAGVILGEVLLSGAIDYPAAMEAAA